VAKLGRSTATSDQAHKMVSMYSDEKINLIAVPVSYYEGAQALGQPLWDWWYARRAAVGMMSWDLTNTMKRSLPPAQQQVLKNQATVLHPNDEVKRTIFLRRDQGSTLKRLDADALRYAHGDQRRLCARANPCCARPWRSRRSWRASIASVVTSSSMCVTAATATGSTAIAGRARFASKSRQPTDRSTTAKQLSSLTVGGVQTVLQQDNQPACCYAAKTRPDHAGYYRSEADLLVLDLTDPKKPTLAGRLVLPGYVSGYYSGCGMSTTTTIMGLQPALLCADQRRSGAAERHYDYQSSERRAGSRWRRSIQRRQQPQDQLWPQERSRAGIGSAV
jgi:hypothetical protein